MRTMFFLALLALLPATTLRAQPLIPPKQLADLILDGGGRVAVSTGVGSPVNLIKGQPWPNAAAEIVEIDYGEASNITDAEMPSIGTLTKLRFLTISRSRITGASLTCLKDLKELTFLNLFQTPGLSDVGWEYVAGLPALTGLSIAFAQISDTGFTKLAPLTGLTFLNIDHTLITDRGIGVLRNFPKLTFLNLNTVAITDAGFESVATLSKLGTLILVETPITDRSVPLLAQMKSLRDLNIRDTQLSPAAAQYLQSVLPSAEVTPSPPVITLQPQSLTIDSGGTAVFTTFAIGTVPLTFQWFFGSATLANETNTTLALHNVTTNQAGLYRVIVSNAYGSAGSTNAVLAVEDQLIASLPTDIRQGLVSYWPLDTTDAVTTPDVTPFGNHLNLVNMDARNFVEGKRGKAASFNGTDELLSRIYRRGSDNGLPIYNARRYTVMLWVNGVGATQGGTGTGDRRVFSEGSDKNSPPLFNIGTDSAGASARTNVVDMLIRNDDGTAPVDHVKSRGVAFDGKWHHIAWVDEEGAASLYIDGQRDTRVFRYTRGSLDLNTISLGGIQRAAAGNRYAGLIDDVAIWERPLTQAEIQQVMTNGIQAIR